MTIEEQFGKAVARIRKEQGFSQERFALEAGVSSRYMTDIEQGKKTISIAVAKKIAKQLNLSMSELFKEVEKE